MRTLKFISGILLASSAMAQTTPQSLLITVIPGINSAWAGECAAGVIDNRSQFTRQNTYHAIAAQGTGNWSVTLQFSNTSCAGPWSSYTGAATINQASNPAIAYAVDPPFGPAAYINVVITGNAVATYTAEKNLW